MKKKSCCLLEEISSQHLRDLTNVVDETIAKCFNPPGIKTFTAAELSNIQQHSKRRIQRRFYF